MPTVAFATDTVGESAQATVAALEDGQVALLENVRFNAGETSKDDAVRGAFADQLAALADAFVSDGFGVVHRKQASVYDVAQRLPHAMGGLVRAEIDVLRRLTEAPERPYVVVLGGSKVSDKLGVIDNLLGKADRLLIGGGMVFTFLKAQGLEVGKSLLEEDQLDTVRGYLERAEESGVEIVLPTDIVVDNEFPSDGREPLPVVVPATEIPADTPRPRHRSGLRRGVRRGARRRPHGVLERPHGRLRDRRVRRRHPSRRRGAHQDRRPLRGRRWRLRRRGTRARLRRGGVRTHLHGRRRQPGVPRGQGTARHHGSGGLMAAPTRIPLMAGNWKMNLNHQEAVVLVQKLAWTLTDKRHDFAKVDVCVLPPFTDLRSRADAGRRRPAVDQVRRPGRLARRSPAPTPARSPRRCSPSSGCSYVVVGHSERREYHAETDDVVNAKAHAALGAGMTPIVCVGEGLDVRQAGEQVPYTLAQVDGSLAGFSAEAGRGTRGGLRAGVGDRHRRGRHARRRAGGLRGDPGADRGDPRRVDRGRRSDPVRRLGQGRERRRDHGQGGRRRVSRGRRQPRRGRVRRHLPLLRHAHVPVTECRPGLLIRERPDVGFPTVELIFTILLIATSAIMILLVLLHKGRGGGLSDMFGGGVSSSLGGSSVAERNLDRFTIGIGVIWFACVIALGLLLAY